MPKAQWDADGKYMQIKLLLLSLISVFILTSCANFKEPDILPPITEKSYPKIIGIRVVSPFELTFYTDAEMTEPEKRLMSESFLSAVVIPERDLWVNLRIEERDRIAPYSLGITELGRVMLGQDYLLKKAASTAYYPENESGYRFWNKIAAYGNERRLASEIRSWIYPKRTVVVDNRREMFIKTAELEVRQEKIKEGVRGFQEASDEIILPEVKNYVLYDQHFIPTRQIYRAVICAIWFKNKFRETIYNYCINTHKTGAFEIADYDMKYRIWEKYALSFKHQDYQDPHPYKHRTWGGLDFKNPKQWVEVKRGDTGEDLRGAKSFKIALRPSSIPSSKASGEAITKAAIGGIDLNAKIEVEAEKFDVAEEAAREWQLSQSIGYVFE